MYGEDPESKITEGTKELFLRTFFLMHDFFAYTLKTKKEMIALPHAFNFMNVLGYQIKYYRGYFLNVDFLVRTLIDNYG